MFQCYQLWMPFWQLCKPNGCYNNWLDWHFSISAATDEHILSWQTTFMKLSLMKKRQKMPERFAGCREWLWSVWFGQQPMWWWSRRSYWSLDVDCSFIPLLFSSLYWTIWLIPFNNWLIVCDLDLFLQVRVSFVPACSFPRCLCSPVISSSASFLQSHCSPLAPSVSPRFSP